MKKIRVEIKRIEDLESIIKIQCQNGNWNYDPYMQGLANGLILAHHTLTCHPNDSAEPPFMNAPKMWLCDRKVKHCKTQSGTPLQPRTPKRKRK